MKYKPWTKEEVDFLRENLDESTIAEAAKKLGRTIMSVRNKAAREKIRIEKKRTRKL